MLPTKQPWKRSGRVWFAPCNRGKLVEKTEEGIDTAMHLLKSGYLTEEEVEKFPGVTRNKKIHPVIECVQNIPCNPCQDACPKHCIKIGSHITALPAVDPEVECIGCGLCVSSCSGQAIFLVQEECDEPGYGTVTLPYEFCRFRKRATVDLDMTVAERKFVKQKWYL